MAVVCGAGINCVGVAPDGRHARFPALGAITGDWGGGYDVGLAAVSAAARSEDGRGPETSLERSVPAHFGLATPTELAEAIHRSGSRSAAWRSCPPSSSPGGDDRVAGEIVDRLASEVVALARVALTRLDLADEPVEVLLGGGLLQSAADGRLARRSVRRAGRGGPRSRSIDDSRASCRPIVGAATARARRRSELVARTSRAASRADGGDAN